MAVFGLVALLLLSNPNPQVAAAAAAAEAEPVDPTTAALVDGAKSALGALAFVALGVSSQGSHDFTEMLTILTLVREGGRGPKLAAVARGCG